MILRFQVENKKADLVTLIFKKILEPVSYKFFSFLNIFLTLYLLFVLYHFRPISVYLYVINKGFFYAPTNLASPIEAELFQIESVTRRSVLVKFYID